MIINARPEHANASAAQTARLSFLMELQSLIRSIESADNWLRENGPLLQIAGANMSDVVKARNICSRFKLHVHDMGQQIIRQAPRSHKIVVPSTDEQVRAPRERKFFGRIFG